MLYLCVSVCVFMSMCTFCECVRVLLCVSEGVSLCVSVSTCMLCVRGMFLCVCVCAFVCVHVCLCVFLCVSVCVWKRVCFSSTFSFIAVYLLETLLSLLLWKSCRGCSSSCKVHQGQTLVWVCGSAEEMKNVSVLFKHVQESCRTRKTASGKNPERFRLRRSLKLYLWVFQQTFLRPQRGESWVQGHGFHGNLRVTIHQNRSKVKTKQWFHHFWSLGEKTEYRYTQLLHRVLLVFDVLSEGTLNKRHAASHNLWPQWSSSCRSGKSPMNLEPNLWQNHQRTSRTSEIWPIMRTFSPQI